MAARFSIERLSAKHDRSGFDCGSEPLNRYFSQQVTQDIRRRVATCFVAVTSAGAIAGYYTLASASVPLADLPSETARRLPRYPSVPAVRMGRLAVDRQFKGQGLGAALLADALTRALSSDIAAFALIVDAKDDAAAAFYRQHGFIAFDNPRALFLPLTTAKALPRA
ncbi:MAG TPA: GNAT family N-acetyltransferase [Burkholderiales bacterium]|nr:GNAT family N-acetyltransferase [Burkholderiales bacterium]